MRNKLLILICAIAAVIGISNTVYAQNYDFYDFNIIEGTSLINDYINRESQSALEIQTQIDTDIVYINGEEKQTEKICLKNDTAMVPLRVFAEGFGAEVDWNDEDQTINIIFDETNLLLRIDSIVADINGIAEIIPEAPYLTQNGTAMVPLRFIAEKFGANVGYVRGEKTIYVSLVYFEKNNTENVIDSEYIGDSSLGWSIKSNARLGIYENTDDYICLMGEGGKIYITAQKRQNYDTPEDYMEFMAETFAENNDFTKTDSKVHTDKNSNGYIEISGEFTQNSITVRKIYTDDKIYWIYASVYNSAPKRYADEYKEYVNSFKSEYNPESDIYDVKLCDEMGCMSKYDYDFDIAYKVPIYFEDFSDGDIVYADLANGYTKSEIRISLAPLSEDYTAQKAIENEIAWQKAVLPSEYTEYSDIMQYRNTIKNSLYFTQSYKSGTQYDFRRKSVYIEKDGYVYNINIKMAYDTDPDGSLTEYLINCAEINELQTQEDEEVIKKQIQAVTDTQTAETDMLALRIPSSFEWVYFMQNDISIMDFDNEVTTQITIIDNSETEPEYILRSVLNQCEIDAMTVEKDLTNVTVGKYFGCTAAVNDKNGNYIAFYSLNVGGKRCFVKVISNEVFANDKYTNIVKDMLRSIEIK